MIEYEQKREEIARLGMSVAGQPHLAGLQHLTWESIDAILSLVEIKADDQSLPYLYERDYKGIKGASSKAQQDMLEAGFVKVIPKPKTETKEYIPRDVGKLPSDEDCTS